MELRIKLEKLKVFDCDECSESFVSDKNLEQHKRNHIKSNPIFICHCGVHIFTKELIEAHLVNAHPIKEENFCNDEMETEFRNTIETKMKKASEPKKRKKVKNKTSVKVPRSKDKHSIRRRLYIKNEDGTFSCIKCNANFVSVSKTVKHYNANHNKESISCEICGEKLSSKKYKSHMDRKHSRKFVCPVCDKGFGQSSFLRNHYVVHVPKNERPYPCPSCEKRFTQTASLKVHMKLHAGIKDYICQYCNKAFTDQGNMVNHERIHTKTKPYKCSYCEKAFSDPSALKRHIRTHTGDKIYSCEHCPMKFTDASGLIAHRLRHSERKIACSFCNSKFYLNNELKTHTEAVHGKIKKFECHHCGAKSYSKHNLAAHIFRVHKKEIGMTILKPYHCDYCEKKTGCKYYLRRHIYLAHGEQLGFKMNYAICHYCNKQFKCKQDLRNHIFRLHGVEAGMKRKRYQFKCEKCKQRCSTKLDLKRHFENRHGNYSCKMCSETFTSKWCYNKHMKAKACLINVNEQSASLDISVIIESIKTE